MKKRAKESKKGALKHEHFHLAVNKQNTMNLVEDEEERKKNRARAYYTTHCK